MSVSPVNSPPSGGQDDVEKPESQTSASFFIPQNLSWADMSDEDEDETPVDQEGASGIGRGQSSASLSLEYRRSQELSSMNKSSSNMQYTGRSPGGRQSEVSRRGDLGRDRRPRRDDSNRRNRMGGYQKEKSQRDANRGAWSRGSRDRPVDARSMGDMKSSMYGKMNASSSANQLGHLTSDGRYRKPFFGEPRQGDSRSGGIDSRGSLGDPCPAPSSGATRIKLNLNKLQTELSQGSNEPSSSIDEHTRRRDIFGTGKPRDERVAAPPSVSQISDSGPPPLQKYAPSSIRGNSFTAFGETEHGHVPPSDGGVCCSAEDETGGGSSSPPFVLQSQYMAPNQQCDYERLPVDIMGGSSSSGNWDEAGSSCCRATTDEPPSTASCPNDNGVMQMSIMPPADVYMMHPQMVHMTRPMMTIQQQQQDSLYARIPCPSPGDPYSIPRRVNECTTYHHSTPEGIIGDEEDVILSFGGTVRPPTVMGTDQPPSHQVQILAKGQLNRTGGVLPVSFGGDTERRMSETSTSTNNRHSPPSNSHSTVVLSSTIPQPEPEFEPRWTGQQEQQLPPPPPPPPPAKPKPPQEIVTLPKQQQVYVPPPARTENYAKRQSEATSGVAPNTPIVVVSRTRRPDIVCSEQQTVSSSNNNDTTQQVFRSDVRVGRPSSMHGDQAETACNNTQNCADATGPSACSFDNRRKYSGGHSSNRPVSGNSQTGNNNNYYNNKSHGYSRGRKKRQPYRGDNQDSNNRGNAPLRKLSSGSSNSTLKGNKIPDCSSETAQQQAATDLDQNLNSKPTTARNNGLNQPAGSYAAVVRLKS